MTGIPLDLQRPPRARAQFRTNDAATGAMLFCFWLVVTLVVLGIVATVATDRSRPVLIPYALTVLIAAGFFIGITRRLHGLAPIFHVGTFYAAIAFIYTIYPLSVYFLNGLNYHELSDMRFFLAQPPPNEIAVVAWWYALYFAAFTFVYFVTTKSVGALRVERPPRPGSLLFVLLLIYTAIQVYLLIVMRVFGAAATTYEETYLALKHLPLIVQQVTGRLQSWVQVLEIVLLVVLFISYKRNRFYIALLLLWAGASTLMKMHARTELFLLLVAAAFLRHYLVRRMRLATVLVGGMALLILFSVLGAARNVGATGIPLSEMMTGTSEFESIFANAHDLMYVRNERGAFLEDPTLYFADFILPFPSQLVPFRKQIASEWYLAKYYPWVLDYGGGFAFGVITESVVGFGLIEAIARGALLALIFAWIDRRFTARPLSVWGASFYVWITVMAYLTFRTTTFTLITLALQLFLVPIVLMQISLALWIRFTTRTRTRAARASA